MKTKIPVRIYVIITSFFFLFILVASNIGNIAKFQPEKKPAQSLKTYKNMTLDFAYEEKYSEIKFENLNMLGRVFKYGVVGMVAKFERALRFENITNAVEKRYDLPSVLIFAMMIEESNGVDLLPNGRGDGGFGLCHMQPAVASDFNLKIYKNCKAMVCNGKDGRSCKDGKKKANHAKDLKNLIKEYNSDRKTLIEYDDRLHPLKNLDAVGRMLAVYRDGPPIKEMEHLTPLQTAICRYAGKYNYEAYYRDVMNIIKLRNDKDFMAKVEKRFNKRNKKLLINGKKGDFEMYIEESQKQNHNYGLAEYEKLPYFIAKK